MLILLTQKGWLMNEMKRIFLGWHFLYWIFFFYILFLQFCRFSKRITRDDGIEPKKWDLKKKKWILFETFFPKKFETFSCVFFLFKIFARPKSSWMKWTLKQSNRRVVFMCHHSRLWIFCKIFRVQTCFTLARSRSHSLTDRVRPPTKNFQQTNFFVFFFLTYTKRNLNMLISRSLNFFLF